MKKFFIILFLTAFSSAYAAGHLSDKDKKATLKCTGLYYACLLYTSDAADE